MIYHPACEHFIDRRSQFECERIGLARVELIPAVLVVDLAAKGIVQAVRNAAGAFDFEPGIIASDALHDGAHAGMPEANCMAISAAIGIVLADQMDKFSGPSGIAGGEASDDPPQPVQGAIKS